MDTQEFPEVLVTGLSGMVGTRLKQLLQDRYLFSSLDLKTGTDITNANQVDQVVQSNPAPVVIHLAAFTDVSKAYEQNGDTEGSCYRVNVLGTRNVAKACATFHKYLIHISTDFVFDGSQDAAYTETDTPHPIEWYGMTKLLAEQAVQASTAEAVILRLAYPYQAQPIRPDFLMKLKERLDRDTLPPQFTNHLITPTWVDDLVQILRYCIDMKPQGLYHACGSSTHSDYDVAEMVKSAFQLTGAVVPGNVDDYLRTINRPYQKILRIGNDKLQRDFGIIPATFPEGLQKISKQIGQL